MQNPSASFLERHIRLVNKLDRLRDKMDAGTHPSTVFDEIAATLQVLFAADACALLLEDSDDRYLIHHGMDAALAERLCAQARELVAAGPLDCPEWPHALAVRILVDSQNHVPGALVLARAAESFSSDDAALLDSAEAQVDSAFVQARTITRLRRQNEELEAKIQIDRLRDLQADEAGLLNQVIAIILRSFSASLCLIQTYEAEEQKLRHSALIDRSASPARSLQPLLDAAALCRQTEKHSMPGFAPGEFTFSPLYLYDMQVGMVIIGRVDAFKPYEVQMLNALASQTATVLGKARLAQQLAQRNRELEAIYRIDRIRDTEADFDLMTQHVLTELCEAVDSETGYLMLYDAATDRAMEIKAATKNGLFSQEEHLGFIHEISRTALKTGKIFIDNQIHGDVRSAIAVPLIVNERIIGVYGALNSRNPRGFSRDDQRMLSAITSQVDTAVFERLEQRRMRKVLSRSVDPRVLEMLLQRADASLLTGERVVITVIFADLRGSTEWSERIAPEELVSTLNTFLGRMTEIVFAHGGVLDKFVGDEVIALFGTPVAMPDHAYHAARAALAMQRAHTQLQSELAREGHELPFMGIGVSSGEVIAGEMGPPVRTDFTAMGRVMNLGSRLCSAALGGQIVISQSTHDLLGERARVNALEPIQPKGINHPVSVYELLGVQA